ncbi:hypothetical protein Pmani_005181 [Petrolisthes manimaculis]|uniref:phosphoethanolamine N-methyltransferase n=1 Tax=Petrolisthes manimaculis TaxID=1843537 RepID=A0AAE1QED5_9EUCA|nr:hypothetical protein Pmani_005181 [Petrolisthes manimaculis]
MKSYWQVYSPTLESMMLSHDATYLAENEQNEILSYLPHYQGKRVLELGAGIGRFTCKLAGTASEVVAVDFMDQYINENRKRNQHYGNIDFKCADVTKLDFPPSSFDLVFSNWLFMYLSDEETQQVFRKVVNWLTPGGHFFMRESCYHQSGNMKRNENPTLYRTPLQYSQMLHRVSESEKAAYKIIRGKSILAYIHYHGNPNQLCFLVKRVEGEECNHLTQFLKRRETVLDIQQTERMFGYGWFSTGGEYSTREFLMKLDLVPGQRVLDVGCGTGGAAFYMARHYGVHVHGVDLSTNMIHLAIERQGKLELDLKKRAQFEISDIMTVELEDEAYDVIYSRDSILFIKEKDQLFEKLYKWLKPGGTLFFTDFCYGSSSHNHSNDFHNYVNNEKQYYLSSVTSCMEELQKVGFDVRVDDLQQEFLNILNTELSAFTTTRQAFINDFSEKDYNTLSTLWANKIRWTQEKQLTWASFTAHKKTTNTTTTTNNTNTNGH